MNTSATGAGNGRVVLITGAAKRIGASIAEYFHSQGCRVIIHYRNSSNEAVALQQKLQTLRPDSANILQADLNDSAAVQQLAKDALQCFGRIDILINNASSFYATPLGSVSEQHWNDLINSNVKAAFFLAQTLATELRRQEGSIINIVDIHAEQGLQGYSVYSIAKAALLSLTQVLARELAPDVRVNGVSPGAILWPDHLVDTQAQQRMLQDVPLRRLGTTVDIAQAAWFLVQAPYVTGQIIKVDGGKSL